MQWHRFSTLLFFSILLSSLAVAESDWPVLGGGTTTASTTNPTDYSNPIPGLGGDAGTADTATTTGGINTVNLVAGSPPTSPFPTSATTAAATASAAATSGCATTPADGKNAGLCMCLNDPKYSADFPAFDTCVKAALAGMNAGQNFTTQNGQAVCQGLPPQETMVCMGIMNGSITQASLMQMLSGAIVPTGSLVDGTEQ